MRKSPEQLVALARQGVRNLVENCAEVHSDDLIVLVNDRGIVDQATTMLIEEAIRARGAKSQVVWVEPSGTTSGAEQGFSLPTDQIATLLQADKVIVHLPRGTAGALIKYLADAQRMPLVVTSGFGTVEQMASGHARYHWGLLRVIHDLMDYDAFPVGSQWRMTTPSGTDLHGVVGDKSLRALYVEDERRHSPGRSFGSTAYLPVASVDAEGLLAVDWLGGGQLKPAYDPPFLEIRNNKLVSIEVGLESDRWAQEYWAETEKVVERFGDKALVIDSWHGGCHPWAANAPGPWVTGTRRFHFHMGRTTGKLGDFVFAQVQSPTLEVDGRKVLDNGKLAMLEHPKIKAAAERLGVEDYLAPRPALAKVS